MPSAHRKTRYLRAERHAALRAERRAVLRAVRRAVLCAERRAVLRAERSAVLRAKRRAGCTSEDVPGRAVCAPSARRVRALARPAVRSGLSLLARVSDPQEISREDVLTLEKGRVTSETRKEFCINSILREGSHRIPERSFVLTIFRRKWSHRRPERIFALTSLLREGSHGLH